MMHEIYGDFNNLDDENRIRLTTLGSLSDIARLGIQLREGLALTITADDADDDGNPDDLMADGIIRYNEKEKCWVAQIDWSKVHNRSERETARSAKGSLGFRNGSAPRAKKPKSAPRKPGAKRKAGKSAKKD
jgi:hypothetical protein